jgi:hypothetical protein
MVCARPHRNSWILSLEEKTKILGCRSGGVTNWYQSMVTTLGLLGLVGVGSHSWIAAGAEPDTHQFYVTICFKGVIGWIETQENIARTQKTGLGM